jgi:hypothetical protein
MYVLHVMYVHAMGQEGDVMSEERRQKRRHGIACWLRDSGVPLEIPRAAGQENFIIRQQGGLAESRAFDLDGGGTGFIVDLEIIYCKNKLTIDHFLLEVPWQESTFRWLDDPIKIDAPWNNYRFPGKNPLEFPREVGLNHVAGLTRSKGQVAEGLLLGFGSASIPCDFTHGKVIPAFVTIFDKFDNACSCTISLWADRSAKFSKPLRNKPRPRLFDHADVEVWQRLA